MGSCFAHRCLLGTWHELALAGVQQAFIKSVGEYKLVVSSSPFSFPPSSCFLYPTPIACPRQPA